MNKELLRLIEIVYWRDHNHCGADFDKDKCQGDDFGACPDFEFCQLYKTISEGLKRDCVANGKL